jgi:trehalose 6-phosphate synthase/phosphatase
VAALDPALREHGGEWIGWAGISDDALQEVAARQTGRKRNTVRYTGVRLSPREMSQHYAQFSNRTLWPVFHYFLERASYDAAAWAGYDKVNERFAAMANESSDAGSLFWVHDYQLLRVPLHLRRLRPHAALGFFLHTPFPAADVFRCIPWSRLLVRGMLGADYLGFHTATYASHFLTAAETLLGCEVDRGLGTLQHEGRTIATGAHPVGIDADEMERLARSGTAASIPHLEERSILGVDRLDYTKGIQQRLLAVEHFFNTHAEHRGRVVFTQVAVPSRERVPEYGLLKREIDELVGRINGRFAARDWAPIRYITRSLDKEALGALYASAHVALVTPLRDGMNLVAKEYVASQVADPGVLILSELAGAAEELQEAIHVNPFDMEGMADAMNKALNMSHDERHARMAALRDRVRAGAAQHWSSGFLRAARAAAENGRARAPTPLEQLTRRLEPWLAGRERTALLLDYDGTLTPTVDHPDLARLGRAGERALRAVASATHIDVTIVSGRSLADLKRHVPDVGLTLAGNHGMEIDGPGIRWSHPDAGRWSDVLDRAACAVERLYAPGAWVERKGSTFSWHLRQVNNDLRSQLQQKGEAILRAEGLTVVAGKMVVDARPPLGWHKGRAVLYMLTHRYGKAWPTRVRALYLGDDTTDEDAFRSLTGMGRSVRIGGPDASSAADHGLPNPSAVHRLLLWLAAGAFLGPRR